jgi:hypothetical protein
MGNLDDVFGTPETSVCEPPVVSLGNMSAGILRRKILLLTRSDASCTIAASHIS